MSSLFAGDPEQFLPPLLPWHGASESLVMPPDDPWITPGELSQLSTSPNYANSIAYLEKLVASCPLFSLQEIGRSAQGRPLYLVIATKENVRTPAALSATGKPIVFVQAGIHPGEIDGKDAGLMLLRDIAHRGKAPLLDGVHLLFVPVLNSDGHERSSKWSRPNQRGPVCMGWRTNAQNLNLNRDFPKLDAPETRAVVALFNIWQPSLLLDLQVTDGLDYQYDVSYSYNGRRGEPAYSPQIAKWLDTVFDPHVDAALKQQGHVPVNFYIEACNDRDLEDGLTIRTSQPRFCQGYGDIRHMASVLVETHSLKTHRQRVLGTYVLLEATLALLNRESAGLMKAIAADKAARAPLVLLLDSCLSYWTKVLYQSLVLLGELCPAIYRIRPTSAASGNDCGSARQDCRSHRPSLLGSPTAKRQPPALRSRLHCDRRQSAHAAGGTCTGSRRRSRIPAGALAPGDPELFRGITLGREARETGEPRDARRYSCAASSAGIRRQGSGRGRALPHDRSPRRETRAAHTGYGVRPDTRTPHVVE